MSLVAKTIRFDPEVWEMAATEASHLGIPTSEFIRSAVLARCMISMARRDGKPAQSLADLYAAADRFLEDNEQTGGAR